MASRSPLAMREIRTSSELVCIANARSARVWVAAKAAEVQADLRKIACPPRPGLQGAPFHGRPASNPADKAKKVLNLPRAGRDLWPGCDAPHPLDPQERPMIRKLTIALAATVALGAAALAPTAASAFPHHYHHGWHHGWHVGFYGPDYGPDCYIVRRVVQTPWGPRARRVTVCD